MRATHKIGTFIDTSWEKSALKMQKQVLRCVFWRQVFTQLIEMRTTIKAVRRSHETGFSVTEKVKQERQIKTFLTFQSMVICMKHLKFCFSSRAPCTTTLRGWVGTPCWWGWGRSSSTWSSVSPPPTSSWWTGRPPCWASGAKSKAHPDPPRWWSTTFVPRESRSFINNLSLTAPRFYHLARKNYTKKFEPQPKIEPSCIKSVGKVLNIIHGQAKITQNFQNHQIVLIHTDYD